MKDILNLQDVYGRTALSIGKIIIKTLKLLLYNLLLLQATRYNKPAIVEELLKAGANPNIMNNRNETALLIGNYIESDYRQSIIFSNYFNLFNFKLLGTPISKLLNF